MSARLDRRLDRLEASLNDGAGAHHGRPLHVLFTDATPAARAEAEAARQALVRQAAAAHEPCPRVMVVCFIDEGTR